MPSVDDLMRETALLRAENDLLKQLLRENGIALPAVVPEASSAMNDEPPADAASVIMWTQNSRPKSAPSSMS